MERKQDFFRKKNAASEITINMLYIHICLTDLGFIMNLSRGKGIIDIHVHFLGPQVCHKESQHMTSSYVNVIYNVPYMPSTQGQKS